MPKHPVKQTKPNGKVPAGQNPKLPPDPDGEWVQGARAARRTPSEPAAPPPRYRGPGSGVR